MGAGIATFDGSSIDWTVLYDEMIVVIEGTFRLGTPEGEISAKPGDVIWIPENTPISYRGEKAAGLLARSIRSIGASATIYEPAAATAAQLRPRDRRAGRCGRQQANPKRRRDGALLVDRKRSPANKADAPEAAAHAQAKSEFYRHRAKAAKKQKAAEKKKPPGAVPP